MENITQQDFEKQRDLGSIYKVVCSRCKKTFYIRRWYHDYLLKQNKGRGIFCSRRCALIGRPISEETIEKIRSSQIGIPRPQSGLSNEQHSQWKGEQVGRNALHRWLWRHKPAPSNGKCQFCKTEPFRDLANITLIYNRAFKNWKYLCVSCHKKYDYEHGVRKHSEETKEKIRLAQLGRKFSEEHKEKIRLGNLKYQLTKRKDEG